MAITQASNKKKPQVDIHVAHNLEDLLCLNDNESDQKVRSNTDRMAPFHHITCGTFFSDKIAKNLHSRVGQRVAVLVWHKIWAHNLYNKFNPVTFQYYYSVFLFEPC